MLAPMEHIPHGPIVSALVSGGPLPAPASRDEIVSALVEVAAAVGGPATRGQLRSALDATIDEGYVAKVSWLGVDGIKEMASRHPEFQDAAHREAVSCSA